MGSSTSLPWGTTSERSETVAASAKIAAAHRAISRLVAGGARTVTARTVPPAPIWWIEAVRRNAPCPPLKSARAASPCEGEREQQGEREGPEVSVDAGLGQVAASGVDGRRCGCRTKSV